MQETIIKLHKLNSDLIIEMAEKDQLIKELSQENQALRKVIRKMEVRLNESK